MKSLISFAGLFGNTYEIIYMISHQDIFFWKSLQRPMDFQYDESKRITKRNSEFHQLQRIARRKSKTPIFIWTGARLSLYCSFHWTCIKVVITLVLFVSSIRSYLINGERRVNWYLLRDKLENGDFHFVWFFSQVQKNDGWYKSCSSMAAEPELPKLNL